MVVAWGVEEGNGSESWIGDDGVVMMVVVLLSLMC